MKIYISLDMEGIPGTFNWDHEKKNPAAVKRSIHDHLTDLIQAIQKCSKNSEIKEILIADSHSSGDNIDYEWCKLDERINLISGGPRPTYMMPMLDSEYDYVFFIGYHAGTGSLNGNMDHSYSNSKIQKISINGKPMNEALINAAYAGCLGVPVALVTGDLALKKELMIEGATPWVEYVTTKEGFSKFAAKNYNPIRVQKALVNAVNTVFSKDISQYKVFTFATPVHLQIEFHSTAMADMACLMPGTKRIDGKTIEYVNEDYPTLFEAIVALITLAYATGI